MTTEDFLPPKHAEVVVNDAFLTELLLCSVPQRVVRLSIFKFLEGVEMSLVGLVLRQRGFRPLGQGFVFRVVFDHGAVDEANVPPV